MKKKGFTLIELLAVIIILALIALIAVPQIIKILNNARLSAAEDSTYGIVEATENYISEFLLKNDGNFPNGNLEFECKETGCEIKNPITGYKENIGLIEYKGKKATSGTVYIKNNGSEIIVEKAIINGFECNYPIEGKAKCKSKGEATEITNIDVKINGSSIEIFADANGTVSKYEYAISETPVAEADRENLSYSSNNTLTGLINNKTYYVYVKATAGNNVIIKEMEFEFKLPTAEIIVENETEWTKTKNVTIKYPSGEYEKTYIIKTLDGNTTIIEETKVTEQEITMPIDVNCIITAIVKSGEESQPISKEVTTIDTTAPNSATFTTEVSETTITVTASGTDSESDIYGYQFSNDNGITWLPIEPQKSNIYPFENLTIGNSYNIKVRAYNNTYPTNKETSYLDSEVKSVLIEKQAPTIQIATNKTYKAIVYLDPTNLNKKCDASNTTVATGRKSGCMKWYAYAERDTEYDLILAHNTTGRFQYYTKFASQFAKDTAGWDSSLNVRNIKATEVAQIANISSFSTSNTSTEYSIKNSPWLYNYTVNCTSWGCEVASSGSSGFWTAQGYWAVTNNGKLRTIGSANCETGVRPVITVSKDLFI